MDVLVTGANGFLGGHVVKELHQRGFSVLMTGSRRPEEWHDMLAKRPACVVHLAWFAQAGDTCPRVQARCGIDTIDLADVLVSYRKATPMVFASTTSVYGLLDGQLTPANEGTPVKPNCSYTRAKARTEFLLGKMYNGYGLTVLRLGSLMGRAVKGGRERTDLVVNAFASQAYSTGKVEVWNPASWKPVVHVRDAAREIIHEVTNLVEAKRDLPPSYTRNLCSQCVTAQHVAQLVQLQTGCEVTTGESPRGNRSVIVETGYPRAGERWIEIPEAIKEWEGWKPGPHVQATDPARWKV